MMAFVGGAVLGADGPAVVPQVPRLTIAPGSLSPAASELRATTSAQGESTILGAVAPAGQAFAALVAVCGLLGVAKRRRGERRPRLVLGPTSGNWYHYRWKAKPGDKYRYRVSTDWDMPEWGEMPEAKGRLIKYGELFNKGTPTGAQRYKEMEEAREAAEAAKPKEVGGALLVDCDGTIVETERDGHRVAFNRAFKEKGYDCEWDVGLYGELLTTGGGKERMARYFADYKPEAWPHDEEPAKDHPAIVELHALKTKLFMEIVRSGELPLREGIRELLDAAMTKGWKIAVCSTSNEDSVKAVVETLLPSFASDIAIFAGDCVSRKKPDPEIYELAAKELGVAPMKCVVIEDTNIGMAAGKAAGMQVVVTKSIYSEDEDFDDADLVLTSASEVDFEADIVKMIPTLELA